jgi:tetratricopeptide (TPR) repeat protein
LASASELGDDGARGHALLNKCIHRWAWLELEEAIAAGHEAAALLEGSGDVFQVATVLAFVALALIHVGRLDEARQVTHELEPLAERLGNHVALLMAQRVAGMAAFFETGDTALLEAFGQADLAGATRLGLTWVSHGWAWQGLAAFLRGDWDVARPRFEEARCRELPGALHGWDTGPLIECLAYLGERSEAMSLLDGAVSQLPEPGSPIGWGPCTIVLAGVEAWVLLGEPERAAALYALTVETLRRTRSVSGNFYDGRLLERVAGIAAMAGRRWDESEAHFRAALEQAQTIPHRPEQAHTRRWYGHMLLQRGGRGDAEHARRLLEAAIADYERMAMPRHRELAAGLL